jgi:hypothetical protein
VLTRRAFASQVLGSLSLGLLALPGCRKSIEFEGRLIKSVLYTSGGGMTGGGESSELRRQKDGSVTLATRSREWHNSRETGFDYVVDESAFDRFAQIANDYDLLAASKRKDSTLIVYDAPSSSLSFTVMKEDGTYDLDASFRISSNQELTDRDREGFHAVVVALSELAAASEGVEYLEPATMTIVAAGVQHQFTLNESPAAYDLASRCPLEIEIENYADNEKIFHLDEPLDVSDTPLATGEAGTLCYFEPDNDVVVFYKDGEPAEGLYELGRIDHDAMTQYLGEVGPGAVSLWSNVSD